LKKNPKEFTEKNREKKHQILNFLFVIFQVNFFLLILSKDKKWGKIQSEEFL